jgi:hypothetical protein
MVEKNPLPYLKGWRSLFQSKAGLSYFILSIVLLIASFTLGGSFINYIEHRNGYTINDSILNIIPSFNCNIGIFIIEYSAVIFSIIYFAGNPEKLITIANTYSFIVLFRMATISIVPLNPPNGLIILRDPIIYFFTHHYQTKDLFFSGHTAFVFAFTFIHYKRYLRIVYILLTLAISALLLIQKVHYSIDILCAIPSAFICYRFAGMIQNRIWGLNEGTFKPI